MSTQLPPPLYCANHPTVETSLRCNNCEKPICPKCAVLTPTGYRCRDCVRTQQKVFETAIWFDYPLAFAVAAILAFAGSYIASFLGFFTLFVAPIAGVIAAEAVRFVTQRRRSPRLYLIAATGAALGSLPLLLIDLLAILIGGGRLGGLLGLVWQGLYTFMVTSSFYYRLRGINIR
jgi:B-box zinc finger